MESISLAELEAQRESWRKLRKTIVKQRENLLNQGQLTPENFDQMVKAEKLITKLIDEINNQIFAAINTDLQEPAKSIQEGIEKANEAIAQLQQVNRILQFVNSTINLVQTIISTISTGNIANIATIINQIREL
jgi:hypothetical protein